MKSLKDAKRKCVFEITEEDVAAAKPKDKNFCVIACAMKEMIGVRSVEVGSTTVRVTGSAITERPGVTLYEKLAIASRNSRASAVKAVQILTIWTFWPGRGYEGDRR